MVVGGSVGFSRRCTSASEMNSAPAVPSGIDQHALAMELLAPLRNTHCPANIVAAVDVLGLWASRVDLEVTANLRTYHLLYPRNLAAGKITYERGSSLLIGIERSDEASQRQSLFEIDMLRVERHGAAHFYFEDDVDQVL